MSGSTARSPEITRRAYWVLHARRLAQHRNLPMPRRCVIALPLYSPLISPPCLSFASFHLVRQQLLYGLLGSDLLGFQTHNYARHFRQTCSRILSLEALPKGIQLESSFVDVAVFPIGLDIQDLTKKRCVFSCFWKRVDWVFSHL